MKITDFNLLNIDVYDGEDLIYSGTSEEAPDELKNKQIKIDKMDGKKLKIRIVK